MGEDCNEYLHQTLLVHLIRKEYFMLTGGGGQKSGALWVVNALPLFRMKIEEKDEKPVVSEKLKNCTLVSQIISLTVISDIQRM